MFVVVGQADFGDTEGMRGRRSSKSGIGAGPAPPDCALAEDKVRAARPLAAIRAAGLRRREKICRKDPKFSAKMKRLNYGRNKNFKFTAIRVQIKI